MFMNILPIKINLQKQGFKQSSARSLHTNLQELDKDTVSFTGKLPKVNQIFNEKTGLTSDKARKKAIKLVEEAERLAESNIEQARKFYKRGIMYFDRAMKIGKSESSNSEFIDKTLLLMKKAKNNLANTYQKTGHTNEAKKLKGKIK